ncbi:uncharacterized protein B0I36DRAFT_346863 [Microdochium trichocladiopsis]|uniref:Uncharacterized protein n=1 Tax=Microdochium trichocladiopsis TaxID=1682393 RepID=A0A9P8YBT5_9PEZI|nr:uncharacterized protein B0I36DRAFT_346863 [Microdochium trichocladiopsis]KAH7035000.1 hypothetical protein B0I36DRAFT_346863 [Microdochium trichocladiopsis]
MVRSLFQQDQDAAKALVSANKTLDRREDVQPPPRSSGGAPASNSTRRMTDKFGRRIISPPISRTNSAVSGTPSSAPGTPRDESAADTDIDRASTLLSLYELRAKVREQNNSSLVKAREKVNALAAKQQGYGNPDRKRASTDFASRFTYPK